MLFAGIGVGGLLAFALVIYLVYQQTFTHFLPENRALRELESRSANPIQTCIENAIRFRQGSGTREIAIDAAPPDDRLEIRACDNGPGIEPRYREKIFELFDRLDDSVPGTGLALARRIFELHGGRIWIETPKNGHGSCFCFTLPAAAGEES